MSEVNGLGMTNANWDLAINDYLQKQGMSGVAASASVEAGVVNVTLTDEAGEVRTLSLEIPELEDPNAKSTEEISQLILDKLEADTADIKAAYNELCEMVASGEIGPTSTGPKKILFDIYAMMALMIDIAQKQKNAAMALAEAELQSTVSAIERQADKQHAAAIANMAVGICLSVLQIGVTALAAYKSYKASASVNQAEGALGLHQAGEDLSMLVKAKNEGASKVQMDKAGKGLTGDQKKTVDDLFNDTMVDNPLNPPSQIKLSELKTKIADIKSQAETKSTLEQTQSNLQSKKSGLEGQITAKNVELETLKKTDPKNEAAIQKLKGDIGDLEGTMKGVEDEIKSVNTKLNEIEKLPVLKEAYNKALDDVMTGLDADSLNQNLKVRDLEAKLKANPSKEQKAQLESELKTAKADAKAVDAKRMYGKAKQINEKVSCGLSLAEDLSKAEAKVERLGNAARNDADWKQASADAKKWETIANIFGQLNGIVQAISGNAGLEFQQSATKAEADQKTQDARRQEIKDLADAAQKLLAEVVQLFQQIMQAESGSMDQIINKFC